MASWDFFCRSTHDGYVYQISCCSVKWAPRAEFSKYSGGSSGLEIARISRKLGAPKQNGCPSVSFSPWILEGPLITYHENCRYVIHFTKFIMALRGPWWTRFPAPVLWELPPQLSLRWPFIIFILKKIFNSVVIPRSLADPSLPVTTPTPPPPPSWSSVSISVFPSRSDSAHPVSHQVYCHLILLLLLLLAGHRGRKASRS